MKPFPTSIPFGRRRLGSGAPVYLVAEVSANHGQDKARALEIVHAFAEAGADAIKLQTYTPDTMTIDCDAAPFQIRGGLWDGRNLYDLYREACTPWDWHAEIIAEANRLGLECFSTPFDATSLEFLEKLGVPAHKVASFEVNDIPLLRRIGATGKPVVMSTGMATLPEIETAVSTLRAAGCPALVLLKCTSSYPAPIAEMNLRTLPDLASRFGVPAGLSDHTMGHTAAVAAVALGACLIEKHVILRRSDGGPDSPFSMEPHEFAEMVRAVRETEAALGVVRYAPTAQEERNRVFRRSIFVVRDVPSGRCLGPDDIRIIRPAMGLAPAEWESVLGRRAARDLRRGEPLAWDMLEPGNP